MAAEPTCLVQLRLPPSLYAAIEQAVAQRKASGERASINQVACEWLERGKEPKDS